MIIATNITAVIEDPQDKVNKQLIKDDLNLCNFNTWWGDKRDIFLITVLTTYFHVIMRFIWKVTEMVQAVIPYLHPEGNIWIFGQNIGFYDSECFRFTRVPQFNYSGSRVRWQSPSTSMRRQISYILV
jgi:hypothetical protein